MRWLSRGGVALAAALKSSEILLQSYQYVSPVPETLVPHFPWCLLLEGVPGLPGAPQDEAGLTRKFETSHVGGRDDRGVW